MSEPKRLLRQRPQQQRQLQQQKELPPPTQQLQQQLKEPTSQRRTLEAALDYIHTNESLEFDATDAEGEQGGQLWRNPTKRPTPAPTTSEPTKAPTSHPTLHGKQFILRGVSWYDRNGNGVRDSNVVARGMGHDVEYSHGVGGVQVQLLECDADTGRAYKAKKGEAVEKKATTITQGVDNRMAPMVVPTNDQNGKFNIRVPGLERHYYVVVKAPVGYLITAGICNDDQPGWECDYVKPQSAKPQSSSNKFAASSSSSKPPSKPKPKRKPKGFDNGIRKGRSKDCVFVDRYGTVEGHINFGVMRVGDSRSVGTKVALVLGFDKEDGANYHSKKNNIKERRVLEGMLRRATKIEEEVDDGGGVTKTRYLLDEQDRDAIGTVTAEVLASVSLDRRLAENDVTLDSVDPKEVIVSEEQAEGTELAVELEIKGHYSPPPELDFDYIVQSSINADTQQIRRGLRDYNSKCRDQTSKVNDEGLVEEDFGGITSMSGTNIIDFSSRDDIFSTACSSNLLVPEYFETSLNEIEAKKVEDVVFFKPKAITYYEEEYDPLFESWAVGPVAAIAGLIVLLVGFLLFRRALRPRRVDKYVDTHKTKDVDGDEKRRFGEKGGAVDDGSVDSAFYSDSEEEEETEKERKKRRRRKEKGNEKGKEKISNEERKALRRSRRALMVENNDEELPNLVSGKASRGRNRGQLGMSQASSNTVDSEFNSDLGSDLEETDKERKARRKKNRKQKEELLKQLSKTKPSKTIKEGSSTRNLSQVAPNTTSRRRSSSARNLSRSASSATMSRRRSSSAKNLSRSASSATMSRRRSSSAKNLSRSTSAMKSSSTKQRSRTLRKTASSSNVLSMDDFAMDPSSTPSTRRRRKEGKLSVSMGGEAGINNSSSFSSSEGAEKNSRRKGKRGAAKSSLKRSSSSMRNSQAPSLDRQPSRRGRSKQYGGDNAKSFNDAEIV